MAVRIQQIITAVRCILQHLLPAFTRRPQKMCSYTAHDNHRKDVAIWRFLRWPTV